MFLAGKYNKESAADESGKSGRAGIFIDICPLLSLLYSSKTAEERRGNLHGFP